jgi:Family of unknown function (DUF6088)
MRGPALDLKPKIRDRIAGRPAAVWTPAYDFPVINRLTQKPTPPSTRAVIDAVARRDHARLVVDGMTAANDLGLTTAAPAQVTVLTDARLKPLQLGAQRIRFRQAAPSRLYWAGRPAMRVVQALHWLHDVLPSDRNVILRRLRQIVDDPDQGAAIAEDLRQGAVRHAHMDAVDRARPGGRCAASRP